MLPPFLAAELLLVCDVFFLVLGGGTVLMTSGPSTHRGLFRIAEKLFTGFAFLYLSICTVVGITFLLTEALGVTFEVLLTINAGCLACGLVAGIIIWIAGGFDD